MAVSVDHGSRAARQRPDRAEGDIVVLFSDGSSEAHAGSSFVDGVGQTLASSLCACAASRRRVRTVPEEDGLVDLVEPSSRPALWAMMEIYSRVLRKIVRRNYDVFTARARLSNTEKLSIALQALAFRLAPGRLGSR